MMYRLPGIMISIFAGLILAGCQPDGGSGGSGSSPQILDIQTYVQSFNDHEAESDMSLSLDFYVTDDNGIHDIDYAYITFPDGTTSKLSTENRLYERNGYHYIAGTYYMDSYTGISTRSFPMHGYKVEVFDNSGASTTQIFSVLKSQGEVAPGGSQLVHPQDYSEGSSLHISALQMPVISNVTLYSDGIAVEVNVVDERTEELQFFLSSGNDNWFTNYLELDTSKIMVPGTKTYYLSESQFEIDDGMSLQDTAIVVVNGYDAGNKDKEGPFTEWSWLGSSSMEHPIDTVSSESML